jgi:hypothetical protein
MAPRMWIRRRVCALSLAVALGSTMAAGSARAGEEDDLQRQIETQRGGVSDIERLDELHTAGDEITLLKAWLDEAWALRAKHEYDQVREVLDRALAQAELIRQKINVSKLRAQVDKREAQLQDTRRKTDQARKALADTTLKKRALEVGSK